MCVLNKYLTIAISFPLAAGCSKAVEHEVEIWRSAAVILCVSDFVTQYVAKWSKSFCKPGASIQSISLSAFGVYGDGPFPDVGSRVVARMYVGVSSWPTISAKAKIFTLIYPHILNSSIAQAGSE